MDDKNEQVKIKEARYLIIIPLLITVVCAWLDFWTNYEAGTYAQNSIKYNLVTAIVFCIVTAFYGRWIYANCLNEKIKIRKKKDKDEEELLKRYMRRNKYKKR